MNRIQIRQGDVMAIGIKSLPKGLKKKKDNILVHSDSTLHDHILVKGTVFVDNEGKMYADAPVKTQIVHTADHDPVNLPKGFYEIRRQVQYSKGDMVQVVVD
jgi:hypothetical protein